MPRLNEIEDHDEKNFRLTLDMFKVPQHLHDGLVRYVLQGVPTGSFLRAVMTNDLYGACYRADAENQSKIWNIVMFLINGPVPAACWGSEEKVQSWIAKHVAQRKEKRDGNDSEQENN